MNFSAKFCEHFHVAPEAYETEMLHRTLYPSGRWLCFIIGSSANFFWPDRDFLRGVGLLTRLNDFEAEMRAFTFHPQNTSFLRRRLKLRVSAKKTYLLLREVMKPDAPPVLPGGSGVPFTAEKPPKSAQSLPASS